MLYKERIDKIVDTIASRVPDIVPWINEEEEDGY